MEIGIYPDHSETTSELFQNVDVAMMSAKQRKENYYDIYHLNIKNPTEQSLLLETILKQALQEDFFELHYQPKIDILNGNRLEGMEVLIRRTDEVFGFNAIRPFYTVC